jgi:hypothetical protein
MVRKNKGGRPARHAGERLTKHRTFRVRGRLDETLQDAAQQSGRSVSEEIEYRLERTFLEDRRFGGAVGSEVLLLIQLVMALEGVDGRLWNERPDSAETVRTAANFIIAALTKLPLDLPPPEKRAEVMRLAKQMLLRSSARRELPPEILAAELEPVKWNGDDNR